MEFPLDMQQRGGGGVLVGTKQARKDTVGIQNPS